MNHADAELRAAQRSLVVFGVYLLTLAIVLLAVPNVLLALFGLPPTSELSVHTRVTVPAFFLAFVVFAGAPWQLLLFGVVDLVGSLWTWWSLTGSSRSLVGREARP